MALEHSVPATELYFYWLFTVLFVATALFPQWRGQRGIFYRSMRRSAFAPPQYTVIVLVSLIVYTLSAWSAFRVRTLGVWLTGVNLVELVLYVVLRVLVAAHVFTFFELRSLGASAVASFASLVLAFIVAWLVSQLDWLAGVFVWLEFVWLLYLFIVTLTFYTLNGGMRVAARGLVQTQLRPKTRVSVSAPSVSSARRRTTPPPSSPQTTTTTTRRTERALPTVASRKNA